MSDLRSWAWLPEARPSTVPEIREALARMRELLGAEWNRTVENARDVLVDRVRGLPLVDDDALVTVLEDTCGPARASSMEAMVCGAILTGLQQRCERDLVPVPPSVGPMVHRIMRDAAYVDWLRAHAVELVALLDHPDRDEWLRAAVLDPVLRSRAAFFVVLEGLVGPEEIQALLTDPSRAVRGRTMVGLVEGGTPQGLATVIEIASAPARPGWVEAKTRRAAREILAAFVASGQLGDDVRALLLTDVDAATAAPS